ncbi:MAG: hypothetical protein U5N86_07805 [Planctomycetota bacterium]|nr:hypothetical protein [Planctomycetota bacterium]
MKKTIIVIAAIAQFPLVVAYNGYKAVQIITSSSSQEPEESDSAVAASAALTSTDEKAVPSPSVEPVESQTPARTPAPHRVDLQHHFLASEGKMFLTFSRNGLLESRFFKETDTPETDIATLAIANSTGSSPTDIAELSRFCAPHHGAALSVDESGFVQFDFEEEAEALLAKNNIKVGSIKGLIAVSGKRVVIGKSGNSFHERLTNNFPFGEGQGSFAEVVATGADKDVYGRITGGPDELPGPAGLIRTHPGHLRRASSSPGTRNRCSRASSCTWRNRPSGSVTSHATRSSWKRLSFLPTSPSDYAASRCRLETCSLNPLRTDLVSVRLPRTRLRRTNARTIRRGNGNHTIGSALPRPFALFFVLSG